jgi:two-component system LytT family response regulator
VIYNCIIVEDNPVDRNITAYNVGKMSSFNLVGLCTDGAEAAVVIEDNDIDVVFSDIDMPILSGTELLKALIDPPVFVFISSHASFAAETYHLNAIDFIVKPFKFERFYQAACKAIDFIESKKLRTEKFQKELSGSADPVQKIALEDEYFFIYQSRGVTRLKYSDVLYIESMGDSSVICTVNNEKLTVLVGLKNLTEQLPTAIFKRIHRRFIVNKDHIEHIIGTIIRLDTKQTLMIGEQYRKNVIEEFINKKIVGRYIR